MTTASRKTMARRVARTNSRPPPASSPEARKRMQTTRQRDTGLEVELRSRLHKLGLRFRLHRRLIPGTNRTVDIVFPGRKVAVFVDGCFWHGCPEHGTWPKSNVEFWRLKIEANRARDADTNRRLRDAGWTVVRIWGHEDSDTAAEKIAALIGGGTQ